MAEDKRDQAGGPLTPYEQLEASRAEAIKREDALRAELREREREATQALEALRAEAIKREDALRTELREREREATQALEALRGEAIKREDALRAELREREEKLFAWVRDQHEMLNHRGERVPHSEAQAAARETEVGRSDADGNQASARIPGTTPREDAASRLVDKLYERFVELKGECEARRGEGDGRPAIEISPLDMKVRPGDIIFWVATRPDAEFDGGQPSRGLGTHVRIGEDRSYIELGTGSKSFLEIRPQAPDTDGMVQYEIDGKLSDLETAVEAGVRHALGRNIED